MWYWYFIPLFVLAAWLLSLDDEGEGAGQREQWWLDVDTNEWWYRADDTSDWANTGVWDEWPDN